MGESSKIYLDQLRNIFLQNNIKVSDLEMASDNYDDDAKLIKDEIPTITTDLCEIGVYSEIVYFTIIIATKSYSEALYNSLRDFPNVQIYGFKNFKKNLYPKPDFNYEEFEKELRKDKYFQIQFNFNIKKVSPDILYKEHVMIRSLFNRQKTKVINQLAKQW